MIPRTPGWSRLLALALALGTLNDAPLLSCFPGLPPAAVVSVAAAAPRTRRSNKRPIQIVNEGKAPIRVYWVNVETREEVLMSNEGGVLPGTEMPLNSYVGHEFVAREVPGKDGKCKVGGGEGDGGCGMATFVVSENDGQMVQISEDFQVDFVDERVKAQRTASELLGRCREGARHAAGSDPEAALNDLVKCVEAGVAGTLEKLNEEIAFQESVRKGIAEKMENYTCLDSALNTTEDVHKTTWTHRGTKRVVHVKHDRPASRIHVVEKFIDDEECLAMEKAAEKSLHRATVADGKGGSRLSEHRKALQAGIVVPWGKEADGDPIARLSRRVYDYANHVLGLGIEEHGQEDLMSIQYEGRGKDDTAPDRYTPHCDGDCTGLLHKNGQRMATMVMYCDVPEEGGHTNFRNAGVHVKPERGNAIFFSYIDPETKLMDSGFTEHSGCPVFQGSKKIVTQWIRLGVTSENPWDSYNTLGVSKKDLAEYDLSKVEADNDADEGDVDEEEADYEDEDDEDSVYDHEQDEL